jgi:hypothetical protein
MEGAHRDRESSPTGPVRLQTAIAVWRICGLRSEIFDGLIHHGQFNILLDLYIISSTTQARITLKGSLQPPPHGLLRRRR